MTGKDYGYLSPVQLKGVATKKQTIRHNQEKSDIFSLGMTFLELLSLENILFFYDFRKSTINWDGIDTTLKNLENQYSRRILDMVRWMIYESEEKRPTFDILYKELLEPRRK
jgi:hypothetical protein